MPTRRLEEAVQDGCSALVLLRREASGHDAVVHLHCLVVALLLTCKADLLPVKIDVPRFVGLLEVRFRLSLHG